MVTPQRQEGTSFIGWLRKNIERTMLLFMAMILILTIVFSAMRQADYEYSSRLAMVVREESNLLLAFEENVRRDLNGVDEILRELKQEFEVTGKTSSELLARIETTRSLPVVHISMANDRGIIEKSTKPELVSMDVSGSEYFQHFSRVDDPRPFYAKPVIGRQTQKWLFHFSRRLNRADGSFGGAATVGVDPAYFGDFYQKMQLGKGFVVSIAGLDGFIRMRQTADQMEVGADVRQARLFTLLKEQKSGSFVEASPHDKTKHIYSYRAMANHPFVLVIGLQESEAFADYYRLRDGYWLMALMGSCFVIGFFGLLIRMVGQRDDTEHLLRQMNEQLAENVAERTEELEKANKELQIIAMMDGLTGIANRRFFDNQYSLIWRTSMRQGKSLTLIMADIDWFKAYNDTYGHQTGDDCLKQVANTMRDATKRAADFVARYGGEEFVVILPDTDSEGAVKVAERLRAQLEGLNIEHSQSPFSRVTISLGVANAIPGEGRDPLELIYAADKALYEAKHAGRNRVGIAGGGAGPQP